MRKLDYMNNSQNLDYLAMTWDTCKIANSRVSWLAILNSPAMGLANLNFTPFADDPHAHGLGAIL